MPILMTTTPTTRHFLTSSCGDARSRSHRISMILRRRGASGSARSTTALPPRRRRNPRTSPHVGARRLRMSSATASSGWSSYSRSHEPWTWVAAAASERGAGTLMRRRRQQSRLRASGAHLMTCTFKSTTQALAPRRPLAAPRDTVTTTSRRSWMLKRFEKSSVVPRR